MSGNPIRSRGQCQCLRMIAYGMLSLDSGSLSLGKCRTRAMCHHSPRQLILAQPGQCMESPADFERANALEILTFEEKLDFRISRSLPFEACTDKSVRCLWSRSKV